MKIKKPSSDPFNDLESLFPVKVLLPCRVYIFHEDYVNYFSDKQGYSDEIESDDPNSTEKDCVEAFVAEELINKDLLMVFDATS